MYAIRSYYGPALAETCGLDGRPIAPLRHWFNDGLTMADHDQRPQGTRLADCRFKLAQRRNNFV